MEDKKIDDKKIVEEILETQGWSINPKILKEFWECKTPQIILRALKKQRKLIENENR